MNPTLRIHPGDERLAHGVVRSAALEQVEIAERAARRLRKCNNAAKFILGCRDYFGQRLATISCGSKLTGSRARVDGIAFETTIDGDYVAVRFYWRGDQYPHVFTKTGRIVITRHAVARYLQRSSGNADVNAAVGVLLQYICRALMSVPYVEGQQIRVTGPEGQLRITHADEHVLGMTWVSDRTSPEMRIEVQPPAERD